MDMAGVPIWRNHVVTRAVLSAIARPGDGACLLLDADGKEWEFAHPDADGDAASASSSGRPGVGSTVSKRNPVHKMTLIPDVHALLDKDGKPVLPLHERCYFVYHNLQLPVGGYERGKGPISSVGAGTSAVEALERMQHDLFKFKFKHAVHSMARKADRVSCSPYQHMKVEGAMQRSIRVGRWNASCVSSRRAQQAKPMVVIP